MKRMNRYTGASKLLVLLLCAVLLVGTLPAFSALGAKKAKTGATKANAGAGSITVSLKTDVNELPPNAEVAFTLYKVAAADPTDYDGWKFDEAFTSYGKKIKAAWKKSTLQDEVNKLAEFISEEKYAGTTQDISSGSTTFAGLEDGLYVGVLTKAPKGLTANAALYAIPSWNADKTELLHALTPIPKDEYTPEIRPDRTDDEVTVTKTDGVQQIPGATFTLSDGTNTEIFRGGQFHIRTADEKMAKFLPEVGGTTTLTLKEEEAPTGYTKSDKEYKVVITAKESTGWDGDIKVITTAYTITVDDQKDITIENPPITDEKKEHDSVTVTKTDGVHQIPGAIFTLSDGTNTETFRGGQFDIRTGDKDMEKFLPAAGESTELTLEESSAPAGYKKSSTKYKVVITAEEKAPEWNDDHTKLITVTAYTITIDGEKSLTVENPPITDDDKEHDSITIKKTDGKDTITGATFTLSDGTNNVPFKGGEFEISTGDKDLEKFLPTVGETTELTLKETEVPTGYTGSDAEYKVVIKAEEKAPEWNADHTKLITVTMYTITIDDKKSVTVVNTPITGEDVKHNHVTVYKQDDSGSPLTGAEFTLYSDTTKIRTYGGAKVSDFTIDTNDPKLANFLPKVGESTTLTLKETKAPSGYQRSNDKYDVVIKATQATDWNNDHTKLVTTTTYTIAFKDDAKKDDVTTLEVVNEPTTTTPSPTPDGDTPDTPGGGGGVPEPSPTPEPTTDISGTKVWADDGNAHKVRPGAIEITLLADGSPVSATPTWTKDGDRWTYTFTGLPQYSSEGNEISYTVEETPVDYYKSSVSGMTITNELIPSVPSRYIDLSGQKTWNDNENKSGKRPTTITIRLLRDGEAIESRSVTAGSDWSYTFQHLPVDDGYGHTYTYEIREDGVPGYYTRYDGTNVTNSVIDGSVPPPITDNPTPGGTTPERPEDIPDRRTGTPVPRFEELGDEELEELFDMFGYGTPLYGMLGTGDQIPIWVWICSGVGVAALVLFLITGRKKKKAK